MSSATRPALMVRSCSAIASQVRGMKRPTGQEGVVVAPQRDELQPLLLEEAHQVEQAGQRAAEAVELGHDDRADYPDRTSTASR